MTSPVGDFPGSSRASSTRESRVPGAEDPLQIGDRSHFHHAVACGGTARRPFDGLIERGQLEDDEAAELLFGIGVRSVLDLPLAAPNADGGGGGVGALEGTAAHV